MTEFSHSQEAKLAEVQQKAMLKGEAFPDVLMTLYEAIVRDYTGRTPEAREQTLIVTHLNEDRRVLNSMIHDAREKAGERQPHCQKQHGLSGTSYGIAGLLMLAVSHRLYRAEDRMERLALVACLLAVIPALNLATSDAAAVAGLVMTVLTVGLVSCAGKSLPRFWPGDFFPTFYACHLSVLGVLAL